MCPPVPFRTETVLWSNPDSKFQEKSFSAFEKSSFGDTFFFEIVFTQYFAHA